MGKGDRAIRGILFDLDGVLYVGSQAVPGAVEAVDRVRASGRLYRFITNTSTQSLASLQRKLKEFGFTLSGDEILSAPQATLRYLHEVGGTCHLLLAEDVAADFTGIPQVPLEEAEYLVLGDIGTAWTYELLNRVFNAIMRGARLIAVHKNRFWQTEQGLRMDIGGFVAALEYCTGTRAVIMGKPSAEFFAVALRDLGLPAHQVAIVGDDIESDVGGGQAVGLTGILVRTGKFRQEYVSKSPVCPDYVIDSVADLPQLLGIPG
jgi:HAD superfamily hydrolase (TIGR01458 family)